MYRQVPDVDAKSKLCFKNVFCSTVLLNAGFVAPIVLLVAFINAIVNCYKSIFAVGLKMSALFSSTVLLNKNS